MYANRKKKTLLKLHQLVFSLLMFMAKNTKYGTIVHCLVI